MKNLIIIVFLAFISTNTFAKVEHQVDKSKKNVVKFISDAPVEDFEGITSSIDGYMLGEKGDFKGTELYFEVDLNLMSILEVHQLQYIREVLLTELAFSQSIAGLLLAR